VALTHSSVTNWCETISSYLHVKERERESVRERERESTDLLYFSKCFYFHVPDRRTTCAVILTEYNDENYEGSDHQ